MSLVASSALDADLRYDPKGSANEPLVWACHRIAEPWVAGSLVAEGQMMGYEVTQRFYEIGSPVGLEETRGYLQKVRSP